jgi:hypothetical protein
VACSLSRYLDSVVRRDRTFVQRLGESRNALIAGRIGNSRLIGPMPEVESSDSLRFGPVDAYDVQPRHDIKSSVVAQNGDSPGAVLI